MPSRGGSRHARTPRRKARGLPDAFLSRLRSITGDAAFAAIAKSFVQRPPSFRINTLTADSAAVREELARAGLLVQQLPWYADGFFLRRGKQRDLERSASYREGGIYLQSLASMVPPLVLAPRPGERVLDATAAPGSKTGQIAQLMAGEGELVALERDPVRFERLRHNLELLRVSARFGERLTLRRGDAVRVIGELGTFDRILLDAPCSAEARFVAAEPRTFAFWSEERIRANASAQRRLLAAAWRALRPGGTLVYSTCTFAPEENELVVRELLEREPGARLVPASEVKLRTIAGPASWGGEDLSGLGRNVLRIYPTAEIESFCVFRLVNAR